MDWFDGDIAEAVRLSKEKNVIFVVFINGKANIIDKVRTPNEKINFLQAKQMTNPWISMSY